MCAIKNDAAVELCRAVAQATLGAAPRDGIVAALDARLFDHVLPSPATEDSAVVCHALLQLYTDLTDLNQNFLHAIRSCYGILMRDDDVRRINPIAALLHECRAIIESQRADYAGAQRLFQTAGGLNADLFADSDAQFRRRV